MKKRKVKKFIYWKCKVLDCEKEFENNIFGIYYLGKHFLEDHLEIWKTVIKKIEKRKKYLPEIPVSLNEIDKTKQLNKLEE